MTWQHIAKAHCNTLQHIASHDLIDSALLQHSATHCNTLQHTTSDCIARLTWECIAATQWQHTAIHCNKQFIRQRVAATRRQSLLSVVWYVLWFATHCKIMQHTATHCNTLQHMTHSTARCCNSASIVVVCVWISSVICGLSCGCTLMSFTNADSSTCMLCVYMYVCMYTLMDELNKCW